MPGDDEPPDSVGPIEDDRLRQIFTCCHPSLAMEALVALTLRMIAGLTTPQIASAFLVPEPTVGQRITRAKAKIKAAHIPYRIPPAEDLPRRVTGVLTVRFGVQRGLPSPGTEPVRSDLTGEAILLTRVIRVLLPQDGEVAGLLALMLLTEARLPARISASGELVTLEEQDRGAWDAELSAEGIGWCANVSPPASHPAGTRSLPRSTLSTPAPATSATPIGRRLSPCTTS